MSVDILINSFSASVDYAIAHGYGVVCRATTGLTDARITNDGDKAEANDIICVHAHGSNSNIELAEPTSVGSIWVVRDSDGSYGNGVEFTIPGTTTESGATAIMAGYVAKFMNTYVVTIAALRTLFRNTASNGGTWQKENGYGTVDFTAVENSL